MRLYLLLAGIALVVVVARTAEMVQVLSGSGAPMPWGQLMMTEAGIFAGWALWAAALIPMVTRLVDNPPSRLMAAVGFVLLAIAPVVLVPVVASPIHRAAFARDASLTQAWTHMAGHNAITFLLLGATFVGVAHGYLSLRRARRLEVAAAQLSGQLADAQLETLRAQLDPHFLFNALNSITVLARRGLMKDVEQMVTRLAGLLRHSLETSGTQQVTLDVELTALRHYLEIEQVRHGERLVVSIAVPESLHGRVVPSFLLQPLVENAVRHGFTDPDRPLRLTVRAEALGAGLRLTVADDGAGPGSSPLRDGVGLGNTRARLAGLYGGRAMLELKPGPGGQGTVVTVEIPG